MNKETMKKLVGFYLSYRRYLGAAALFIVFTVILVNCTGPQTGTGDTQTGTEVGTEPASGSADVDLAVDADPELVELVGNYYTAYASADLETLESIAQPLTDNEKSYIGALSDYYEAFQNITCYSTQGADEDTYLVSVCYDLKFYEVDTAAPGMDFLYVERDGKGNLIVNNLYSAYNRNYSEEEMDDSINALIATYNNYASVVALKESVQASYEEAVKSDEKLSSLIGGTLRDVMAQWRDSIAATEDTQATEAAESTESTESAETTEEEKSSETTEKSEEESEAKEESTTGTVKTKDICKVRKEPSTDSEVLGTVLDGVKLTKLGTEGDWTKVEFQGGEGYIKSSLLKNVKKKS